MTTMIEALIVAFAGFLFGILYFRLYRRMLSTVLVPELTLQHVLLFRLLRAFLLLVFAGSFSIGFGLKTLLTLPGIYLARFFLVNTITRSGGP